jgi:hypothetical protein
MAVRTPGFAARAARAGLGVLPPAAGATALAALVRASAAPAAGGRLAGEPVAVANVFLWGRLPPADGGGLYGELLGGAAKAAPAAPERAVAAPRPPPLPSPAAAASSSAAAMVNAALTAALGAVPAPGAPLADAGLDSLAAVDVRNALSAALGGASLPASLAFDHPTPAALTAYVVSLLDASGGGGGGETAAAAAPLPPPPSPALLTHPDLDIVSASCQFGGTGPPIGLAGLWPSAAAGGDSVAPVPPARWPADRHWAPIASPGRANVRLATWLPGADRVDAAAFRLAPGDAAGLDPQARRLLECAAAALAPVPLAPADAAAGGGVGLYVGVMHQEFVAAVAGAWREGGRETERRRLARRPSHPSPPLQPPAQPSPPPSSPAPAWTSWPAVWRTRSTCRGPRRRCTRRARRRSSRRTSPRRPPSPPPPPPPSRAACT